ncbi:MAG: GNAT family N-acetyltransferase [Sedimentisphaerales bacterium]
MSGAVSIVEAKESDLPAIKGLLAELVNAIQDSESLDINKAMGNCRILLNDANCNLLVAKVGDSVVGFINFTTRKTALHLAPSGLIDELIVSEKYRGQGIGRQLISAAVDKCRQLGCCEIEVSTEKTNTKAREFYKSSGFEDVSILLEMHL